MFTFQTKRHKFNTKKLKNFILVSKTIDDYPTEDQFSNKHSEIEANLILILGYQFESQISGAIN